MDVLVERCAGLDVHRDSVMATVRLPATRRRQREQHTRGRQLPPVDRHRSPSRPVEIAKRRASSHKSAAAPGGAA